MCSNTPTASGVGGCCFDDFLLIPLLSLLSLAVGQVQTGRILYKQQVKAVPADIDALMTSNHLSGIPKLPLPDGVTVTWYTDYTTESATIGDGALVVYTSEVTGTDSTTIKALCDEINAMMEEATTTYTEAQDGPTLQFTNVTSQITCGEQETATGSEFFIIARGS